MLQRLAISIIDLYRYGISPLKPSVCRFYPSCSLYMQDAIIRYGLLGGFWRGIKRLLRCHPWHPGGFDPVD